MKSCLTKYLKKKGTSDDEIMKMHSKLDTDKGPVEGKGNADDLEDHEGPKSKMARNNLGHFQKMSKK